MDFFTIKELTEIAEQGEQLAGSDYETDSEGESSENSDNCWYEELTEKEQEAAEQAWQKQQAERQADFQAAAEQQAETPAESSNSTENQEEPTELSEAGKEIMKIMDSMLVSTEPSGSGKKVEDLFFSNRGREEHITPMGKMEVNHSKENANALYHMSEKAREELVKQYEGLDKIIYDRLLKKTGKRQLTKKDYILRFPLLHIPILGPSISNSLFDDLGIELETSFSITEVKEIFAQTTQKSQQKLQLAANQIIRMEKNFKEQLADKDRENKDKEKELTVLKAIGAEELKKTKNWKKKQEEVLQEKTKALESMEKVELTEIKNKYDNLVKNAKNIIDEVGFKNQAISDYIRLINQQELKIEILKQEWAVASGGERELSLKKSLLQADYNSLQTDLNSEKRERQTDKNIHERERTDWKKHEKNLIENEKKTQAEREQYRLDFLKIQTERDDLLKTVSPQWLRTIFGRIDWMFGTQLETSGPQFWGKTVFWTKLVLFTLFLAISLWVISWIIRILAAVWRNCKAAFVKKQDTASVLKELIGGIKEAKDSLKRRKKKTPTIVQEVEERKRRKKTFLKLKQRRSPN